MVLGSKNDTIFETIGHLHFSGIKVYKVICASCNHTVHHTLTCYKWAAETMNQTLISEMMGSKGNIGSILGL
jgi:hypothetical protein